MRANEEDWCIASSCISNQNAFEISFVVRSLSLPLPLSSCRCVIYGYDFPRIWSIHAKYADGQTNEIASKRQIFTKPNEQHNFAMGNSIWHLHQRTWPLLLIKPSNQMISKFFFHTILECVYVVDDCWLAYSAAFSMSLSTLMKCFSVRQCGYLCVEKCEIFHILLLHPQSSIKYYRMCELWSITADKWYITGVISWKLKHVLFEQ